MEEGGFLGENAIKKVGSRFDLIIMAAARAREISRGSPARVESKNKPVVTALKEIEQGKYTVKEWLDSIPRKPKGQRDEHYT